MKTAYANRMSKEEFDERYGGLTDSEKEIAWREEQINPLFDRFLRFEHAFTRRAIDVLDISDEDAEAVAEAHSTGNPGGAGPVFAYFLRQIKTERQMRRLQFAMTAVWESEGEKKSMSFQEIYEKFDKLPKGNA